MFFAKKCPFFACPCNNNLQHGVVCAVVKSNDIEDKFLGAVGFGCYAVQYINSEFFGCFAERVLK